VHLLDEPDGVGFLIEDAVHRLDVVVAKGDYNGSEAKRRERAS
jgi:hypothetical protein